MPRLVQIIGARELEHTGCKSRGSIVETVMIDTGCRFKKSHHLGKVLLGKVSKDLPTKPEEIDLRFLTMIRLGDTYDGSGDPVDGQDCQVVMYGNQIAYQASAWYDLGTCIHRERSGDVLYRSMYHASRLYLKVLGIGRALFFRQTLRPGVNPFFVSQDDLKLLENHPQWKEVVNDMGLKLKPVGKKGKFRLTVSKFYESSQPEG